MCRGTIGPPPPNFGSVPVSILHCIWMLLLYLYLPPLLYPSICLFLADSSVLRAHGSISSDPHPPGDCQPDDNMKLSLIRKWAHKTEIRQEYKVSKPKKKFKLIIDDSNAFSNAFVLLYSFLPENG